jgi:predicted ester cyclase
MGWVRIHAGATRDDPMRAADLRDKTEYIPALICGDDDLDVLDRLYATSVLCHRPPLADIRGLESLKETVTNLRRAFSEIQVTVERAVSGGCLSAALWNFRGSHSGQSPVMPIPPTHRKVSTTGSTVSLWSEGEIVEQWTHLDWLGLCAQLGVIPPMR